MTDFKKLKCKKQFGNWFYKIEYPEKYGCCCIDGNIYHLYNENKQEEQEFGSYGDMKYYVETGIILS